MNKKELNVRREIAKFTLRNVSEKLSDSKLKAIIGGYSFDNCDDPAKFACVDCKCGDTYWGKVCGYCALEIAYSCALVC